MNNFDLNVDTKDFNKLFEHKLWKIYILNKNLDSAFWNLISRKKVIYFFFPKTSISQFPFYVGETGDFKKTRFPDHKEKMAPLAEKILILESKNFLTSNEAVYYESKFVEELEKKQKIPLKNKKTKKIHDLPILKEKEYKKTFEELKIIINSCLSFELFKKREIDDIFPEPEPTIEPDKESSWTDLFFLKKESLYDAKARFLIKNDVNPKVVEKIEIIAGSWVSENQWNKYKDKKIEYFKRNVKAIKLAPEIEKENNTYIFKKNSFYFKSPSGAANFFIPSSISGRTRWLKKDEKTNKKITLKQYLRRKEN